MTRCLTAAVLAAALLAVLGYRRGREMAEPEDVLPPDPYLARVVAECRAAEGVVVWQDARLALIEHVATRRWRSPYCPECLAAEAAGLR